jgi:3'-phosphoadenosine 5'-phosphosulfate sulfotransferase (PAPS reductase)/FAD synthetase
MFNDILSRLLEESERAGNIIIFNSFLKTAPKIETKHNIICSISGGSDSDIMLDILARLDTDKKIIYVFFDTGIEYQATKKHLAELETKYNIKIERIKAIKPVPAGCKQYGLPFWSKYVSEQIERLQRAGFTWEDKPFEELITQYPKCKSALKWWCNLHGENSRFNIAYISGLKEYMTAYPPTFRISNKCCKGAKKDNAKYCLLKYAADLNIVGIRKAEGGVRSAAYKSCFDLAKDGEGWDNYRPIFYYTDKDKAEYEQLFNVVHSECYTKYGLTRTGCAGCPFGKDFEKELVIIQEHEPQLYKAVNAIFGESYEYTRRFYQFRKQLKEGKTDVHDN